MINKIFKIGVPLFLLSIIILIGYKNYKDITKNTATPLEIIPMNAAVILQINDTRSFNSYLNNKYISRKIKNIISKKWDIKAVSKKISKIYQDNREVLRNNTMFISLHKYGTENIGLLFSTIINKENLSNDSIITLIGEQNNKKETYDNHQIIKIKNQEHQFYICIIEDFLFASTRKILIQDAIRQFNSDIKLTSNKDFNQIYSTISNNTPLNLIYNINNILDVLPYKKTNKKTAKHLGSWVASDIKIKEEEIAINGFTMINSKLKNFSDIFQGQKNRKLKIDKYLPKNTSYLLSLGFDNINNLYKNKNLFLQNHNSLWQKNKLQNKIYNEHQFNYDDFIENISDEAGIFSCPSLKESEEQISYIKTKNAILTIGLLQNLVIKSKEVKYKKYSIGKILDNVLIPNLFSDIINQSNKPYFTNIDNYIFFASSAEALKYIIDKYKRQQTLNNSSSFRKYKNIISDNFNLLLYINIRENTLRSFEHNLNNNLNINIDSLEKFTGLSFQLSNNHNMLINNISLLHDKKYKENINERWFIQLDSTIHMSPNIVYNHFAQTNEILVQDKTKNLYFISTDGNIRWKRKIHDYILGGISEVDFYNNRKNQFLFNTNDKLYLIDRNGENVENYPIKLPKKTNFGHSLFDYEKNKKYRILVVGKNNIIYNLDIKGKKVIGWKFEKILDTIVSKPKHFTNNEKDYIICPTNNKLYLLARNGSRRSTLKLNTKLTANNIKIDSYGRLYSIDNEGKLWIGNINGASNNIEIPELHRNSKLCIRDIETDTAQQKILKQEIIFSNQNILHILNEDFRLINKNKFDSKIINLVAFQKDKTPYLLVQTEEKIYLLVDNDVVNNNTIEIKGKNIFKILDDKISIINRNHDFLFSYDLNLISN